MFKGGTSLSKAYNLIDLFSEDIKSRYEYNKYVFKYDSMFSTIPLEIVIETSYYQSVYPVEKHVVGSFVGKFCSERNIILPVPFEAEEVVMNVQSIERTFVDKVFAVCDYKNVTQKLLYEDISYDYAIENGIAIIAESKVFEYKK